jgi:hypothetical protein
MQKVGIHQTTFYSFRSYKLVELGPSGPWGWAAPGANILEEPAASIPESHNFKLNKLSLINFSITDCSLILKGPNIRMQYMQLAQ